jgi:hypothetical protein
LKIPKRRKRFAINVQTLSGPIGPDFFLGTDLTGRKSRAIVWAMMGFSGLVLHAFTS